MCIYISSIGRLDGRDFSLHGVIQCLCSNHFPINGEEPHLQSKTHWPNFLHPRPMPTHIVVAIIRMAPVTTKLSRREEIATGIVAVIILAIMAIFAFFSALAYYRCERRPALRGTRLSSTSREGSRRRRRRERRHDSSDATEDMDELDPDTGDIIRPAPARPRRG
jgi:hypothetical protein